MSDTRRASLDRLDCSKDSIDTIGSGGGDTSSTDTDTIHAVRHLLISFCVWHGFLGTAEVLLESFGAGVLDNDSGSRRLPRLPTAEQQRERLALRDQILAGEVSGAIARVSECVSCPQKRSRLLFRLRCQEFVESIRSGGGDPLQYARMHLQEYGRADAVLYNELQNYIALLAYRQPIDSPYAYLLDMDKRATLASDVDSALIANYDHIGVDPIDRIVRQYAVVYAKLPENQRPERDPQWFLLPKAPPSSLTPAAPPQAPEEATTAAAKADASSMEVATDE